MDKLKKLNGSMIAAIVLSVLLIMSVTAGATLAWFASRDNATTSLTMGEAVIVTVGEDYRQGDGTLAMTLPVPAGQGLLPGMQVTPNIKVHLQESNTNALVRARFITTAEYPDAYEDAAYSDHYKYPDKGGATRTESGRVLDNTQFPNDHVYAGTIYYDYYDSMGRLIQDGGDRVIGYNSTTKVSDDGVYTTEEVTGGAHTITSTLHRVKVRKALVDKLAEGATDKTWTINGISVEVTAANIAELEIRQRGVDLTDAVNRVLSGQRGYGIDPATGEPVLNATVGTKYTRRVADGWAYRDADQCWYYMGSQTNGYAFVEDQDATYDASTGQYADGSTLADKANAIAKDITEYEDQVVGNVTVQRPVYQNWNVNGTGVLSGARAGVETAKGTDKTRNYLGGKASDNAMDVVANEIAVLNNTKMASVDLSEGNVEIDFLSKQFVLPTFINNDYAKAKISFKFTVEAIQDYLVDPLQEASSAADRLPNNLVNAIIVFNNAFPQAFTNQTAERGLAATGAVTNVIPGGGIPSSIYWNLAAKDQAAAVVGIKFNGNNGAGKTGVLYSYGYLEDTLMNGTKGWTFNADAARTATTAQGSVGEGGIKVEIKAFDTSINTHGEIVADYSKAPLPVANYVRGTASALGLVPKTKAGFEAKFEGPSDSSGTYEYVDAPTVPA